MTDNVRTFDTRTFKRFLARYRMVNSFTVSSYPGVSSFLNVFQIHLMILLFLHNNIPNSSQNLVFVHSFLLTLPTTTTWISSDILTTKITSKPILFPINPTHISNFISLFLSFLLFAAILLLSISHITLQVLQYIFWPV
jgi:hypothetical protein